MPKVLIITGPAGDAQGWGTLPVTEDICNALNTGDKTAEIVFARTMDDFLSALRDKTFDVVWSALYYISEREDIIGLNVDDDAWLADRMDALSIPYVGPSSQAMKDLIDKSATHRILAAAGVRVPRNVNLPKGAALPDIPLPAFVKPSTESRSVGIADASVAATRRELEERVAWVHATLDQPALVEDYLPGDEYTVLMLGNGARQEFLPALVGLSDEKHYGRYRILRSDMRGVGITKMLRPTERVEESVELCRASCEALKCHDHVRVDMRVDGAGDLRIIEVNGIPGLKPIKSWSPQLYSMYHPSPQGPMEEYRRLVHLIVDSALERYGLK